MRWVAPSLLDLLGAPLMGHQNTIHSSESLTQEGLLFLKGSQVVLLCIMLVYKVLLESTGVFERRLRSGLRCAWGVAMTATRHIFDSIYE